MIDIAFRETGAEIDKLYLGLSDTLPANFGDPSLNCPNLPPVAVATATPDEGLATLSVSLDGGGSTDADGTIVGYSWDWGGDPVTGVNPTV
ncbi:MAG: hypothetical protein AAFN92_03775, partial [Bacteroidota bacterium]